MSPSSRPATAHSRDAPAGSQNGSPPKAIALLLQMSQFATERMLGQTKIQIVSYVRSRSVLFSFMSIRQSAGPQLAAGAPPLIPH